LPQSATPAVARAFGFDAPDAPVALAGWRARYSGYRGTIPSEPCAASGPTAVRTDYNRNWGGYLANGHSNYNYVYDDQNIPTYYTTCGSTSSAVAAHWIGLGGAYSKSLIQQGFDAGSSPTATNGARLWFDYVNNGNPNNPLVYIGATTGIGDVISEYLTYSTPSSGTAAFHWYDRTTGFQWSPVTKTSLSGYYSGTSADFITERIAGFPLRKFSRITFSAAGARYGTTFANLFSLPTVEQRLTTTGASTAPAMITDTKSGTSAFYQTWDRCS
jgi:hypothetical protein